MTRGALGLGLGLAVAVVACDRLRTLPGAEAGAEEDAAVAAAPEPTDSPISSDSTGPSIRTDAGEVPAPPAAPRASGTAPPAAPAPAAPAPDVRRVDATRFEVRRAYADRLLADPMRVGDGSSVVPAFPTGLSVRSSGGTLARLGVRSGDTILTVQGHRLPTSATAARAACRGASTIAVVVDRAGAKVTLTYVVVP